MILKLKSAYKDYLGWGTSTCYRIWFREIPILTKFINAKDNLSIVTYRVYDDGRVDANGKKCDLHIEKALAVTNCFPFVKSGTNYPHLAYCDYFTVDKLNLDGEGVISTRKKKIFCS